MKEMKETKQMLKEIKYSCPCLFGLESLVADEIKRLGYEKIESVNGRVHFYGDEAAAARANINLRCAERVLIELGEFEAKTFDELFDGVKALPWERFIGKDDAFPVNGWSLDSALKSLPDCQAIVKKAVVEHLKPLYKTEWFKEEGPTLPIKFAIFRDRAALYLDTSGEGLHKRGYRVNSNEAPIKETLAAAMVRLGRYKRSKAFYDPFCGSGTILIEAAMYGMDMAPGLNRRFAAESWGCFRSSIWADARQEAVARIKRVPLEIHGSDISESAVALTLENAKKAGVGGEISAIPLDIGDFSCPDSRNAVIITNPPFGERMLDIAAAEELYRRMGRVFSKLDGACFYILSPNEEFETLFGRKADKKRKLYNGMIKCNLYQYFK